MKELERLLYKTLYEKSFYEFVKAFWNECEPAKLIDGKVIKIYCEMAQYACKSWIDCEEKDIQLPKLSEKDILIDIRGTNKNLCINVPPRHSKSLIFNVMLPVWVWLHYPVKAASISHNSFLAGQMNSKRYAIVNSLKFKYFWPEIKLTINTSTFLKDSRGGELYSLNRNAFTGFSADIIINDDLTNAETARKDKEEMFNAWSYFQNTMPSRINNVNKYLILNIQQRLSPNDITGHILSDSHLSSVYSFIILPAIFKEKTYVVCPISGEVIKFEKGDCLWPERFNDYQGLKHQVGNTVFETQYLQNPLASDSTVIKPDMIIEKTLNEVPSIDNADIIYASHDFPVKDKDTSDYLGSLLGYRIGGNLYLVDCLEKRLAFTRSVDYVKSLDDNYPGIIQIIEDKANGAPILQALQDIVPGMQAFNPGANSKMQRLESASLYMNNVIFVKSTLNENNEYVLSKSLQNLKERLLAFPFVEHDDIVDAFSMMCLFVFIDKRYMVYGRAFNDKNITNVDSSKYDYSTIFFNKEGDVWKACEIFIDYSLNTKLLVSKEMRFKGSIEDGLKALKEFAPKKKMFIDCSATPALTGTYTKDIVIERYEIEDFDKSVTQLNLALDKSLVLLDKSCKLIKSDIESFKFSKTKDDTVKYATTKDGFVSCLRTALRYFGGIV